MNIQAVSSFNFKNNNFKNNKTIEFKDKQIQNNVYVSPSNENLKAKFLVFKGREAIRTQEPNLSTYIEKMSDKMKVDANIKFFLDGLKKIDTDTKRTHGAMQIADIGCCNGALNRTLSNFLPASSQFYGLDLSSAMLDEARQLDIDNPNMHYELGNAFDLPYKKSDDTKKDAIMASSVMHEIYSYASEEYGEDSYSRESILHFLQQSYDSLKPGGVLIIKDPATPQIDSFEPIKIANANKYDGKIPSIEDDEELKMADITQLCTYDKLRRFCFDFVPAQNITYFDENGDCIMPRWLVVEFVRHRKWLRTPENWAYEIKENYGTMTPDQMGEYAKKAGFSIVKIENISIPDENNIYRIKEGEFEIRDMKDTKLSLEDFPMFLEVVLRKPRQ